MQAFRDIRTVEDGYIKVMVPPEMGSRVEVILLPVAAESVEANEPGLQNLEQSGFCSQILAAVEEDVWNDL